MKIVNIVAIAKLSMPLDLDKLSEAIEGSEISSGGGRWLKIRIPPENHYIAFYKSGKFLITGIKSLDQIQDMAQRVLPILLKAGLMIRIEYITIHNIVFMDTLRMKTSIEKLIYNLDSEKACYEPEQFPGLIYKNFGASFLLFPNGKVIITGLKDENKGKEAIEKFRILIEQIR